MISFYVFHSNDIERSLIEKHSDKIKHIQKYGSSLKPCRIHGLAEITYRMSAGTKEWDTAASQIIVVEAGGLFVEPDGKEIVYNRKDVYNRKGYIVANRKENILLINNKKQRLMGNCAVFVYLKLHYMLTNNFLYWQCRPRNSDKYHEYF